MRSGTVHQVLVYDGDACVGWCQYGSPAELPNIKNPAPYDKGRGPAGLADRLHLHRQQAPRPGRRPRGGGGALDAIRAAGGGVVEAYPEQVEGRPPQRGAYFHTGPESCSRSSASPGTGRSPSGAGSCASTWSRQGRASAQLGTRVPPS